MRFWKMDGAGNDFVVVEPGAFAAKALARSVCDRRRGVGADGLLIVDRKRRRFRYLNSDGSETFCGNGARCAAVWLHKYGKAPRTFGLSSASGEQQARIIKPGVAALSMPLPKLARKLPGIQLWHSGVPHAVKVVKDIRKAPVLAVGRPLRRRLNANVTFIQRKGRGVAARTYERGVEAETLACGSGAIAAASAAATLRWGRFPMAVYTASGAVLKVFLSAGSTWLEGPSRVVFEGELKP